MQINKCMGCMEDLTQATCPVCGFDPKTYDKPENALELGVILDGRYLLGAALSVQRGGISYIALDLRLEKTVELFELIPQGCARREGSQVIPTGDGVEFATLEESFRSGIRKAARLEAVPGCAHVTGLFQDNGTSYCVMERLPGDTLRTQVERTGPLPWDQVRLLFVQLAQNMQAFHQAGLVHCGITPDVVRLTREGAQIVPDLFSLRMPGEEGNFPNADKDNGCLAPELTRLEPCFDERSDVYSLAATAYFALTGQTPPSAQARGEGQVTDLNHPNLTKIPQAGIQALAQSLTPVPEQRPDMGQLAAALAACPAPEATVPGNSRTAGTEDEKNRKDKKADKPKKKKRGIVFLLLAVAVLAAAWFLGSTLMRQNRYQEALEVYQSGDYTAALPLLQELGSYSDAETLADSAQEQIHYADGLTAQKEGRYQDAIDHFLAAPGVDGSEDALGQCYMSLGDACREAGKYSEAMTAYANAKDCHAPHAQVYYSYADGLQDLKNEDYESAVTKLTQNLDITKDTSSPIQAYEGYVMALLEEKDYESAQSKAVDYISFCINQSLPTEDAVYLENGTYLLQAEEQFLQGYLAEAKATFEMVPEGAVYDQIHRDDRLDWIQTNKRLLDLEGEWETISGKSKFYQGNWIYWFDLTEDWRLEFSIRFLPQQDGTIQAVGKCQWLSCANLVNVEQKEFTFSCEVKANSVVLSGIDTVKGKVTVRLSGEKLTVSFTATDGTIVNYTYEAVFEQEGTL